MVGTNIRKKTKGHLHGADVALLDHSWGVDCSVDITLCLKIEAYTLAQGCEIGYGEQAQPFIHHFCLEF